MIVAIGCVYGLVWLAWKATDRRVGTRDEVTALLAGAVGWSAIVAVAVGR